MYDCFLINYHHVHLLEPDTIEGIVVVIRGILERHANKLSDVLRPNMKEFASQMLQADFITDVIAESPEYQVVMDSFFSDLQYSSTKEEVEQGCKQLLEILENIGGPCKKASKKIKQDLTEGVKHKYNIMLILY